MNRKKWSNEELEILKNNYPILGTECSSLFIGRSKQSIKSKAIKLNIKFNDRDEWSDTEINDLIMAWPKYTKKKIMELFPNRSYSKLQGKARHLGLKSETNRSRRGDLSFLDNLNSLSSYWWGFIMADGHINKNDLVIGIHSDDSEHLLKLSELLETKLHFSNKREIVMLRVGDVKFCEKWLNILNIKDIPKTYSGIDFEIFKNYFKEFIIGFIDGDGHIRYDNKNKSCSIEVHKSWSLLLDEISEFLWLKYNIHSSVKLTKNEKYVRLIIQNKDNMQKLKSLSLDLPVLERKWNKIIL